MEKQRPQRSAESVDQKTLLLAHFAILVANLIEQRKTNTKPIRQINREGGVGDAYGSIGLPREPRKTKKTYWSY